MQQIQLSILIPSIPSRFNKAIALYNKMLQLVGDKHIEVIMLTDNKTRSIGAKRNDLKNLSRGLYWMILDDDDDLLSVDEIYEQTFTGVDVITFKQLCRNADGSDFIVTFGLGNEVEHNLKLGGGYNDIKRPPWHMCAWHQKFKKYDFADVNYSEDWEFVKQAKDAAISEAHIDKILHSYNFDINTSEASTDSNDVWKNPNE